MPWPVDSSSYTVCSLHQHCSLRRQRFCGSSLAHWLPWRRPPGFRWRTRTRHSGPTTRYPAVCRHPPGRYRCRPVTWTQVLFCFFFATCKCDIITVNATSIQSDFNSFVPGCIMPGVFKIMLNYKRLDGTKTPRKIALVHKPVKYVVPSCCLHKMDFVISVSQDLPSVYKQSIMQ